MNAVTQLSTAMWKIGLITIASGGVATVAAVFSNGIWEWAATLLVLFGIGFLLLFIGRTMETNSSEAI